MTAAAAFVAFVIGCAVTGILFLTAAATFSLSSSRWDVLWVLATLSGVLTLLAGVVAIVLALVGLWARLREPRQVTE